MTDYTTRPFTREKFTDLQSLVTDSALARWPEIPYFLNSDVVWQLPGSNAKDNIRLWYDEHGIAAYAWFTPNSPMTFDLRSDIDFAHPLCDDLIFWCEARARSMPGREPWLIDLESMAQWEDALTNNLAARPSEHRYLQVFAMDKDLERGEFLERHGFHATQHFEWKLARSLDVDIPPASLPPGMKLRHVTPQDFEERVAVHRDAWFKSGFTLERYLAVRDIDGYTPELDLVCEDADGTFASYCIAWVDHRLGVGSFEPVGTRPAYRRMGLGQQVNYEGLRRMKALGMHSAKIGTAGFNDRALGLYLGCGFSVVDKSRTYIKQLM